jgi:hypothetical protein
MSNILTVKTKKSNSVDDYNRIHTPNTQDEESGTCNLVSRKKSTN